MFCLLVLHGFAGVANLCKGLYIRRSIRGLRFRV